MKEYSTTWVITNINIPTKTIATEGLVYSPKLTIIMRKNIIN